MYQVYILESTEKSNKHYVGHTQDPENRLERHNRGLVKSTKSARPWKIIYTEEFYT